MAGEKVDLKVELGTRNIENSFARLMVEQHLDMLAKKPDIELVKERARVARNALKAHIEELNKKGAAASDFITAINDTNAQIAVSPPAAPTAPPLAPTATPSPAPTTVPQVTSTSPDASSIPVLDVKPGEETPGEWEQALLDPDAQKEVSPIIDKLHAIPILGPWILGLFLAPATMRALGKKPASFIETIMGFFKKPKTEKELDALKQQARELLKAKYEITLTDAGKLADIKVAQFLKEKPGDFDQLKYDKLITALKKNAAEKAKPDTTVIVFIVENLPTWKE